MSSLKNKGQRTGRPPKIINALTEEVLSVYGEMPDNRKEAKEQGTTYFFTGVPCRHGHVAPRMTVNNACTLCRRTEARKSAQKKSKDKKTKEIELGAHAISPAADEKQLDMAELEDIDPKRMEIVRLAQIDAYREIGSSFSHVLNQVISQALNGCTKSQRLIVDKMLPNLSSGKEATEMPTAVEINIIQDTNRRHSRDAHLKHVEKVIDHMENPPESAKQAQYCGDTTITVNKK